MHTLLLFAVALLSGLGVGSGGLYLLYLCEWLGMPQYAAQAQNLVFFTVATLASSLVSLRAGRLPPFRLFVPLVFGLFGAVVGASLTGVAPPALARRLFGGVMLLGGGCTLVRAFLRKRKEKTKKMHRRHRKIP